MVIFLTPLGGSELDTIPRTATPHKGSLGHTFMVCELTELPNQNNVYPYVLLEVSVLYELFLGHWR